MGHYDWEEGLVNLEKTKTEGNWGTFHELGHNHQWIDWVLPGTTETSVNLWSVYMTRDYLGLSLDTSQGALASDARAERLQAYLASGPDFSQWSVWTALETYLQTQEAFGWESYTEIFSNYRQLTEDYIPQTDQERIDMWVKGYSKVVHHNLGPFFLAWGLPVGGAALAAITDLPPWLEDPMRAYVAYPAVLDLSSPVDITANTALLPMEVVDPGSGAVTLSLFWGTEDGGANAGAWAHKVDLGDFGAGLLEHELENLSPGSIYFYTVRGTNSAGEFWAQSSVSFNTGNL
jgi:hypothetical protein